MGAVTYESIASNTVSGSSTSVITFSSIPSTYTDLVIVINHQGADDGLIIKLNGDTGSNYSRTELRGDGTNATSSRAQNQISAVIGVSYSATWGTTIVQINNYSNSTTYKSILSRTNTASNIVRGIVNLWRSTSTITSLNIEVLSGTFTSGSTFSLYGIKAA